MEPNVTAAHSTLRTNVTPPSLFSGSTSVHVDWLRRCSELDCFTAKILFRFKCSRNSLTQELVLNLLQWQFVSSFTHSLVLIQKQSKNKTFALKLCNSKIFGTLSVSKAIIFKFNNWLLTFTISKFEKQFRLQMRPTE